MEYDQDYGVDEEPCEHPNQLQAMVQDDPDAAASVIDRWISER